MTTLLGSLTLDSPLGEVVGAVRGDRLVTLGFADHWPGLRARLERRFGALALTPAADPAGIVGRLRRYFAGEVAAIDDVAVETGGTPFQEEVWRALRDVPAGRTRSYGEIARTIGAPQAVRAVGLANGRNPCWLVVPCHRIIGSDGSLTGYAGGLDRKRWLLAHERAGCELPRLARG